MLKSLVIKNYALLRELQMEPAETLNIITGETGAGKSIMLGAIGLLMGRRADTRVLYDEDKKCVIEGTFTVSKFSLEPIFEEVSLDYDPECIIRREISPGGKSRAFINDTPVRLENLREIGRFLIEIHSQHDSLMLGDSSYQLTLIDNYAQSDELIKAYHQSLLQYKRANTAYQKLRQRADDLRKEGDYNQFMLKELQDAQLEAGEQEKLEEDLQMMENAASIKEQLAMTIHLLNESEASVDAILAQISQALNKIAGISSKYDNLLQRVDSSLIELRDVSTEAEGLIMDIDYDPERISQMQERLDTFYKLQKKHQVNTVEELLTIQDDLDEKVSRVLNLDEELEQLQQKRAESRRLMMKDAEALSELRKKYFGEFSELIIELLQNLGIPDARLEIDHKIVEPGELGVDDIEILFTANKGMAPQPLKTVASGGEFSRLMFCIKYILADRMSLPTIIFDEIDTGVSGEIALKMVNMMKEMAGRHQVITISHLPQVAAKGDYHYFVFKDNTAEKAVSRIRKLNEGERVEEIAKMIGGDHPSAIAYENAKELLER